MENKVCFYTPKLPPINAVIPQAVIAGNLIFASGMSGYNPGTGKIVSDNFEEQVVQSFKNLKTVIEEAGSSMDKVVKTTLFMVTGMDPVLRW
jgi:2-iminobutanoate/2-iminopropanoate deaminase